MRLPAVTAHFSAPVQTGLYVARRLRRAKLVGLADDADKATSNVLIAGRAYEDAARPIQGALADRDGADDDLDDTAQSARAALAGRSSSATKEAPYTLIFPDGCGYYTASPLDEEVKRYGELKERLGKYLPAMDPVLVASVPNLDSGLAGFTAAIAVLAQARTAEALAATDLTAAIDAWHLQMEKAYGALVAEVGKAKAERFFPRIKGKKIDKDEPAPSPKEPTLPA